MIRKSLDARVIIEKLQKEKTEGKTETPLTGFNKDTEPVRVKVHSWGTLPDGSDFPLEDGIIAFCQAGATMTEVGENRFLMARGFVMGLE